MRKIAMLLLFDVVFLFFALVVYGTSATAAFLVVDAIWAAPAWRRGFALVVGYFVFLHAFILTVGVCRRIVQPKLQEGTCEVGLNKKYLAWGLNSVFQGLFITSFFDRQIHIIFYLKFAYYRMMGMKLPFGAVMGTRAILRQAELIELGEGAVVGEDSAMFGHVSPNGKTHVQGRIRIGAKSVLGGRALLGPGVTIGENSVVGAGAMILPNAQIGNRAHVGAHGLMGPGARLSDGARLLPGAVLDAGATVPPGEIWGGNPAARAPLSNDTQKDKKVSP